MAPFAGKRKRVEILDHQDTKKRPADRQNGVRKGKKQVNLAVSKPVVTHNAGSESVVTHSPSNQSMVTVQIVTGDYERVTHGLAAAIPIESLQQGASDTAALQTTFTETFLFAAHTASIRCLAISSKAENGKRFLATGSADERISVYSLSTAPPRAASTKGAPTLNGSVIAENFSNRSLGSLNHHDRAITRLEFPTKGKLFSSAEDNTIAISRCRDWTMLSSIKAPIPTVQGRPSGDTAAPGEVPTGVNDFAIHPSQKLMLSVCRGERCMRLWNLMTGKKAGVLNFDRDLLTQVGEGKHSSGEGRRVLWDGTGEHYFVGFERAAALFGIDSTPRAVCKPQPSTKLHQYSIVPSSEETQDDALLAISTEDGRILFFDTSDIPDQPASGPLPTLRCVAQVGGKSAGVSSRIKDFAILNISSGSHTAVMIIVAAGSDGTLWLWALDKGVLHNRPSKEEAPRQIGRLIATHKTNSRITCLGAFVMDGKQEGIELEDGHSASGSDEASD